LQQAIGRVGHDRINRVERRQHLQAVATIERGGANRHGHSQFLDLLAARRSCGGAEARLAKGPLGKKGVNNNK
jgi:hypothetical protein